MNYVWKAPDVLTPSDAETAQRAAGPDLYYALRRLLTECGEGSRGGRALDLLDNGTIMLCRRAIDKAERKS